jgi:uncharacterized protein YjiS (DUF1127 family)
MPNASSTFNPSRSPVLWRPIVGTVSATMKVWLRRARTRRHLRDLDGRQLSDVGLGEQTRQRECAKWFWQG